MTWHALRHGCETIGVKEHKSFLLLRAKLGVVKTLKKKLNYLKALKDLRVGQLMLVCLMWHPVNKRSSLN